MQAVAADSASLFGDLLRFELMGYCPTSRYVHTHPEAILISLLKAISVTTIIPPLIVQVMIIRCSPMGHDYEVAKNRFEICMTALEKLGHIYWHARFYRDFFRLAERSLTGRSNKTPDQMNGPKKDLYLRKRPGLNAPSSATASASVLSPFQPICDTADSHAPLERDHPTSEKRPKDSTLSNGSTTQGREEKISVPDSDKEMGESTENLPLGGLGIGEMTLLGSPVTSFNDWLDDDVLFQTLFPSA